MAAAATASLGPKNEAPRRPVRVKRGTTKLAVSSSTGNSEFTLQAQALARRYSLRGPIALIVLDLLRGGREHDE